MELAREKHFSLAERGCAVVLISHNISIAERRHADTTPDEIVALITGAHPDARVFENT